MRTAIRLLAFLTLAALLAPSLRWASVRTPGETCTCPPAACHCASHHHAMGSCAMGMGSRCGLQSPDSYLASILSTLIYSPAEHHWANPLAPWRFRCDTSDRSLLPAHVRIPDQPPRAAL